MKTITLDKFKEKFIKKFNTPEDFEEWWIEERRKYISMGYAEKPIMKLMVDQHVILPKLIKSLRMKGFIIESEEYPTPEIHIHYYIRNYKSIYR